jgi:hypothetical protein
MDTYQLCTTTARISARFQALDLFNLTNWNFRDIDSTTLTIMIFIQVCQAYASAGLVTPTEPWKYNSTCSTNKSPCRPAKILSRTKCHPSKTKLCSNVCLV